MLLIDLDAYSVYTGAAVPADPTRVQQWTDAITVASEWVEAYCGRQFHPEGTASARLFDPCGSTVGIDDCRQIDSVHVDSADDGTHATLVTDYQVLPPGGRDPILGPVPSTTLAALGGTVWPRGRRAGAVKVTGLWGWATVPDRVARAVAIVAQDLLRDPESAFGGLTVASDGIVLGARIPARATLLLAPYRRYDRVLGIA